jgi:mRNA interferase MazF
MTEFDPGTIVLVRFPFTDLTTTKKRPALVMSPASYSQRQGDIVVLALTSQNLGEASLGLTRWQAAGLPKPTWIKPLIGTLSITLADRRLGQIDPQDRKCVAFALALCLAGEWY